MAMAAMTATVETTAQSMMTMNQDARLSACGEGLVIPIVLIKALAINCRIFMLSSFVSGAMIAGVELLNRMSVDCIYKSGLAATVAGAYT
jgi:hypothetical protein